MKLEPGGDPADNPCRPRTYRQTLALADPEETAAPLPLARSRRRLGWIGTLFTLAFLLISGRIAQLTLLRTAEAASVPVGIGAAMPPMVVPSGRAALVDRNGEPIATSLVTPWLGAHPAMLPDKDDTARHLAKVFPELGEARIAEMLNRPAKYVVIARDLTEAQTRAVEKLGYEGLELERHEHRIYPVGRLASHVAGYVSTDDRGESGAEKGLDEALTAGAGPVALSIDLRLQDIVRDETQKAIDKFHAKGGTGLVMDVRSGEMLALVSLPDFDPNAPKTGEHNGSQLPSGADNPYFNRATLGAFEMGSIFKIFNTALALDSNIATLTSEFSAELLEIGGHTIHNAESMHGMWSVTRIFMESSNTGSARMVMKAGVDAQRDFLGRLGLLTPARLELPEIGTPRAPDPWREINAVTVAFGQGIAVTQIQVAMAAAAVVNGGILRPVTLVKHEDGYVPAGTRVISEHTSSEMRRLFRLVVTNGTARFADVPGYLVGGKTGTAQKRGAHGYQQHAFLSSFLGVFPMNDPAYMVYITVDEPQGLKETGYRATGGWVAAPAVRAVIERMTALYGIRPIVDTPAIHQALDLDPGGAVGSD